jgi:hypothetical protein
MGKRISIVNDRFIMGCMIAVGTTSVAAFIYWLINIIV